MSVHAASGARPARITPLQGVVHKSRATLSRINASHATGSLGKNLQQLTAVGKYVVRDQPSTTESPRFRGLKSISLGDARSSGRSLGRIAPRAAGRDEEIEQTVEPEGRVDPGNEPDEPQVAVRAAEYHRGPRDLRYLMDWEWEDITAFWLTSGISEEQWGEEDGMKLQEWWTGAKRYWQRDGRLTGKTLGDVVELLRRWEVDASFPVFESEMSPEMEFALESVIEGKEETMVEDKWVDLLTPAGIEAAYKKKLEEKRLQWEQRGEKGEGEGEGDGDGGRVLDTQLVEGGRREEMSEEERARVSEEWREAVRRFGDKLMSAAEAGAGGKDKANVESASAAARAGRLVRKAPRDWPPPGWQVDKDELAFIHGGERPKGLEGGGGKGKEKEEGVNKEKRGRKGERKGKEKDEGYGASEDEEEAAEEEEERWRVFVGQYKEWVVANKDKLDIEAATADPLYFPGRRRLGDNYWNGMLELPFIESGQLYAGRITLIHLHEGCFVNIGAVHDGWIPIYNDDWHKLRHILRVGQPVLVQVVARRDPFRFRFPIELRLLHPRVSHLIFRRQRFPPQPPIFSRDGDINLNELAFETGRPPLPFLRRQVLPNRWERLFVEESRRKEGGDVGEHPYLKHVDVVEGAEAMLLQRENSGETITAEIIAQMLPEAEDAALIDLEAAASEAEAQASVYSEEDEEASNLIEGEEEREEEVEEPGFQGGDFPASDPALLTDSEAAAAAAGEPPSSLEEIGSSDGGSSGSSDVSSSSPRWQRLRGLLSEVQAQRVAAEAEAEARDRAVRCQLGLPADEPGREQVVQRITSKDQWWRLMSFLYTSIDLALFPQGIPDETPQRAAEDLQLLQQAAADAAMQAAGSAAAAMGREAGSGSELAQ